MVAVTVPERAGPVAVPGRVTTAAEVSTATVKVDDEGTAVMTRVPLSSAPAEPVTPATVMVSPIAWPWPASVNTVEAPMAREVVATAMPLSKALSTTTTSVALFTGASARSWRSSPAVSRASGT